MKDARSRLWLFAILTFGASAPLQAQQNTIMPPAQIAKIKAALPEVAFSKLQAMLHSEDTIWYDEESMTPSYQDSVGVGANSTWPDLVAASESVIGGLHNRQHERWQFPFSTTAGTDDSSNLFVANFLSLPSENGRISTIPIRRVRRNASRYQWTWDYEPGTVFGEVLFVKDGGDLLATEIRIRQKFADGWAMNAYRPFPTAEHMTSALKQVRTEWNADQELRSLVTFLEDSSTLRPKTLAARAALAPLFNQSGWVDPLPRMDPQLVRDLLKNTTFASAFEQVWKSYDDKRAFAPTVDQGLSVVPDHYDAGVLQVNDESCMRCHQETGRLVSEFYPDLYLYGEIWGKDGIFSFHPFDESEYYMLRRNGGGVDGYYENRKINPILSRLGVFAMAEDFEALFNSVPAKEQVAEEETELEGDAAITFNTHVKPILQDNCGECHSAGGKPPMLTAFPFNYPGLNDQHAIVDRILARTAGARASMPPGVRTKLSARQLQTIRTWKDEGLQR